MEIFDYWVQLVEYEVVLLDKMIMVVDFVEGLINYFDCLLGLMGFQGVVICFGEKLILVGEILDEKVV